MTHQHISLMYGSQNFDTSSAKINVFVLGAAEPHATRQFPSKVLKRVASYNIPTGGAPGVNGAWYQDVLEAEDGVFIMLQQTVSIRASIMRQGAIFLRVRSDGPFVTITSILPAHHKAAHRLLEVLQARGDLMTYEEMQEQGISLPRGVIAPYLDQEEIGECFYSKVTGLIGTTPKPTVEKVKASDGTVRAVTATGGRRRIRVRKSTD